MVVGGAEQSILEFYSGMACQTAEEREKMKKNFRKYGGSFTNTRALVRAGGTPHFIVPGNCARLGANPDDFRYSLEMYSRDIDSPLQQFSMLAGIISFWNEFLTPKWKLLMFAPF